MKIAYGLIPDIVLCDIIMPGVSGYELFKQLAKNRETANIPFIFLSAKSDNREKRIGMNLGADDFNSKPFNEKDLLEAVKDRLAKI